MYSLNGLNASQQFVMQTTICGVLIISAKQVVDGNLTLGYVNV